MIAAALVCAVVASPPLDAWHVEVPLVLTAQAPSSNVETSVLPWLALRAGRTLALGADDNAASFGLDVALLASYAHDGTPDVGTTRYLGAIEARSSASPGRVTSTFTALAPYGFVAVLAGGGAVDVKAFQTEQPRPLGTWGASAGGGALLTTHSVTVSLELEAGVRDLRFEIGSALALGYAF